MNGSRKIVAARILPPQRFGDEAKVFVNLADDVHAFQPEVQLFSYFNDEISFTARELLGLTADQALELRHKRDVAYLQS